jgi:hypothetical protein
MIRKLSQETPVNNAAVIPADALKQCCDSAQTECKYTIAGTTANLVNIKVKDQNGTTVTWTKPGSANTSVLIKAWIEDQVRQTKWFINESDHVQTNQFPEVKVTSTGITIWGQMVVVSGNFGASDVAAVALCTRIVNSTYQVELADVTNPQIIVDGSSYTITLNVVFGTTTTSALKTAIETAIAAKIPDPVLTVTVTTNESTGKFNVKFEAKARTEIVLNGKEAAYVSSAPDFAA